MSALTRASAILLTAGLCFSGFANATLAQSGFYKGKQITVTVNFAPGGGTDIEARLLARMMPAHMDGQPTVIVKNMPGSGGMIAANYIGSIASRDDGLNLGYFAGVGAAEYMKSLNDEGLRVNPRDFALVAISKSDVVSFIRKDVPPGIEKPADIVRGTKVILAGLGVYSSSDLRARLSLDILGVKYQYVKGYRGNSDARAAVMKGEANFLSESLVGYQTFAVSNMVQPGIAIPVFYWGDHDGKQIQPSPIVEREAPIKPLHVLYEEIYGKPPTGVMWKAFFELHGIASNTQRHIVLPPGTPNHALEEMRRGVEAAVTSREFADSAMKELRFVPDYVIGAKAEGIVTPLYTMSPDVEAFFKAYIEQAGSAR